MVRQTIGRRRIGRPLIKDADPVRGDLDLVAVLQRHGADVATVDLRAPAAQQVDGPEPLLQSATRRNAQRKPPSLQIAACKGDCGPRA